MSERDADMAALERLLAEARAEPGPEPDAALYARILADAEAAQPPAPAPAQAAGAAP
ncbi:hypothetical protein E0K89_021430, partial [Aquicoccus sp. SCR17]|nr:hypothetical protein [Carideicomes alvinocaridis]